jgi:cytochrome c-type biogenesis protein
MTVLGLSFLAGLLTCLSPCVFPVVPLIVGSSFQRSRMGPLVLAAGLIVAFTAVGALLMVTGVAAGISQAHLRMIASLFLIIAGLFLLSTKLQGWLSRLLSPVAAKADRSLQSVEGSSLFGQFITGSMLGILWSPCTGPTMGATLALGAQNGPSLQVVSSMLVFGAGAATPILALAYGARSLLTRRRAQVLESAKWGKLIFGVSIIAVGIFSLLGIDKVAETWVLNILPDWVTELSVKF